MVLQKKVYLNNFLYFLTILCIYSGIIKVQII